MGDIGVRGYVLRHPNGVGNAGIVAVVGDEQTGGRRGRGDVGDIAT